MKYSIQTTQSLDQNGKLGAWLFVLSPVASGACYYWFLVEAMKNYGGNPTVPLLLTVGSACSFLGGAVLLLVGRTQSHIVYDEERVKGIGMGGR